MTSPSLPTLSALRSEARAILGATTGAANDADMASAYDLIAHRYGFDAWPALEAASGLQGSFTLGARVTGTYLGHAFEGLVRDARPLGQGRTRMTIQFDEPIDVVASVHFSAFRSRVSCTLDQFGETAEKTSDGRPQMKLVPVAGQ